MNLDEVLASAAALIKRLIAYEIFAVLLPEAGTDQLYFRFAIGHRPEVVEHWRIPMGEGIIGAAAATGQPIRVGDVSKDPRYLNALDGVRARSPLRVAFFSRSSRGSMPSFSAISSIWISVANDTCGLPNPLKAPKRILLV